MNKWVFLWRQLGWALGFFPLVLAAQPQAPTATHTVRPGETLWGISVQHFGQPLQWPQIQQKNQVNEPRRLSIGRVLRFADDDQRAIVFAVTGLVQGAMATDASRPPVYQPLQVGTRLPVGAWVRTGPDSFVTLQLPEGSLSTLPSNSTVRLTQFVDHMGQSAVLLDLEAGDVESRVPPHAAPPAQDAYRVRTRMATVGVRGTYFRVSLPDTDHLAVSVLESRVSVAVPSQPIVFLSAAEGLLISDASLSNVQRMLPPPELIDAGQAQNQPSVLLAWNAVDGAASYRAQLARDVGFLDILAERRIKRTAEREFAVFDGVEPGSYFARVTALTLGGVEGLVAVSGFSRALSALDGTTRWLADSREVEFAWRPLTGGTYRLEVADDASFTRMAIRTGGLRSDRVRVQALPPGQYFWRVRAEVIAQGQRSETVSPVLPLLVQGVR